MMNIAIGASCKLAGIYEQHTVFGKLLTESELHLWNEEPVHYGLSTSERPSVKTFLSESQIRTLSYSPLILVFYPETTRFRVSKNENAGVEGRAGRWIPAVT
ncbi:hypothetical protein GKIL_0129 [Gloeobacter kilaueensis JS1]|uniref:Uncharacterized protein n=1 Tax=Gloeobacter kilaueensis (strain ATCC BAA-2537 / CCAP 1431/1 / ULC 316 / JS1) TaxID=1183438 RepID=U5QC06_GLOK1|nr:hypothetical protein GKIL_0129 [Gloeobacter kilaueensis JS1]